MTDKNDVVIAIAASLYASRATDDALRAEPPIAGAVTVETLLGWAEMPDGT
jgi:hypothetical protein